MWKLDTKIKRYCSDLHINDKSRKDDFKNGMGDKEQRFTNFMEDTFSNEGSLAILGDMVEIEQTSIFDILDKYSKLFSLMSKAYNEGLLMILHGNHDYDISLLNILGIEIPTTYAFNHTILLHGHQFDEYCKKDTWWQRTTIKGVGYLEYIYPKIDSINPDLIQRRYPELYQIHAAKYAYDRGADNIVLGHTHKLQITNRFISTREIQVVNTGCWVNSNMDYIEEVDGIYHYRRWK